MVYWKEMGWDDLRLWECPKLDVLLESLLHLPLWLIFRHMHINLINVRSTYAS